MAGVDGPVVTDQHLSEYEEMGFLHSLPILSDTEVNYYRAEIERTCQALGGRVTRLNELHLFFQWAWDLSTHPRLVDCLEQLMGPNILLTSTRLFYKHGQTTSYVGWHQDGITQRLEDGRAPAIWLGLTAATVENGCLRVVPRSHHFGLVHHDSSPDLPPLPDAEKRFDSWPQGELSGRIAQIPPNYDAPFDLVMRAGEMSIHHPVILHGSNPNLSLEPRIGLSASYTVPELYRNPRPVVRVRGDGSSDHNHFRIDKPPDASFEEAVAAYCASDRQILYAGV
jgi:ectoine hydroxylase-related dioxygenase (phytanoyl-CoA dioxygenase family)